MCVGCHQVGFEATSEQMTPSPIPFVEVLRVASAQTLHAARKRWFWRREQQMEVIPHQYIRIKSPSLLLDHSAEPEEELASIFVVGENVALLYAATGHMPQRTWELDS